MGGFRVALSGQTMDTEPRFHPAQQQHASSSDDDSVTTSESLVWSDEYSETYGEEAGVSADAAPLGDAYAGADSDASILVGAEVTTAEDDAAATQRAAGGTVQMLVASPSSAAAARRDIARHRRMRRVNRGGRVTTTQPTRRSTEPSAGRALGSPRSSYDDMPSSSDIEESPSASRPRLYFDTTSGLMAWWDDPLAVSVQRCLAVAMMFLGIVGCVTSLIVTVIYIQQHPRAT